MIFLFFQQHGFLTEEQLGKSGIATSVEVDPIPRDKKPLKNQRVVLLTHPETLARFIAYENRGLDIGDAIMNTSSGKDRKEFKKAKNLVAKVVNKEKEKKENEEKKKNMAPEEIARLLRDSQCFICTYI